MNRFFAVLNAWLTRVLTPSPQPFPQPLPQPKPKQKLIDLVHAEALFSIGKDASPRNLAPQELSCAEGVSNLIHLVDPTFPGNVISTIELTRLLDLHDNYQQTRIPKPGCVIVSPRKGTTPGHAGIFTHGQRIISNDSKLGKMQNNYSLTSWAKEMRDRRGLKIYFWEPIL